MKKIIMNETLACVLMNKKNDACTKVNSEKRFSVGAKMRAAHRKKVYTHDNVLLTPATLKTPGYITI